MFLVGALQEQELFSLPGRFIFTYMAFMMKIEMQFRELAPWHTKEAT